MARRQAIIDLAKQLPCVLPSILPCDFGDLSGEIKRLEAAGVQGLHLDVMDGNFVPNLTFGIPVVAGIRSHTQLPLDTHLMIKQPEQYVAAFIDAGADAVTIHREAVDDPVPVLDEIRERGAAAGIAIDPETRIDTLAGCVGHADLVLIMSVKAGFGGQSFQAGVLPKLGQARQMFGEEVLLEIDGGVNSKTIAECTRAGAQLLVAGTAMFAGNDYQASLEELTQQAQTV